MKRALAALCLLAACGGGGSATSEKVAALACPATVPLTAQQEQSAAEVMQCSGYSMPDWNYRAVAGSHAYCDDPRRTICLPPTEYGAGREAAYSNECHYVVVAQPSDEQAWMERHEALHGILKAATGDGDASHPSPLWKKCVGTRRARA